MGNKENNEAATTTYHITLLQAATLLFNMYRGIQFPEQVGFEDAANNYEQAKALLQKERIRIPKDLLEALLWSSNLMDEQQKSFWHPHNISFDSFVMSMIDTKVERFDRNYNLIVPRKEN